MQTDARLYNCHLCHCQVIVCRHCDRGQIYCSSQCASKARRLSCRAAAKRYQNTYQGRLKHAARQHRYRVRIAQRVKKVTHQGSKKNTIYGVLPTTSNQVNQPVTDAIKAELCCHFCKRIVSDCLRTGFIRHSHSDMTLRCQRIAQGP